MTESLSRRLLFHLKAADGTDLTKYFYEEFRFTSRRVNRGSPTDREISIVEVKLELQLYLNLCFL